MNLMDWGKEYISFPVFISEKHVDKRLLTSRECILSPSNQRCWILLNRSIICVFILSRTCINNLYIERANRLYHAFLRYCCCYRAVSYSLYRCIILSSSLFSASFELFVRRLVCVGQLRIDLNNIEHTQTLTEEKKNNFSDTKFYVSVFVFSVQRLFEMELWNYIWNYSDTCVSN